MMNKQIQSLTAQRDGMANTNSFLEKNISDLSKKLGMIEEARGRELKELKTTKD